MDSPAKTSQILFEDRSPQRNRTRVRTGVRFDEGGPIGIQSVRCTTPQTDAQEKHGPCRVRCKIDDERSKRDQKEVMVYVETHSFADGNEYAFPGPYGTDQKRKEADSQSHEKGGFVLHHVRDTFRTFRIYCSEPKKGVRARSDSVRILVESARILFLPFI